MITLRTGELLAPRTSLELGGPAQRFVECEDEASLLEALELARLSDWDVTVLGGGSNVVVADQGVTGLVVAPRTRGVEVLPEDDHVALVCAAGEPWDALVGRTVEEGWQGLECLGGIPGLVGAVPIQNVGAYGQEVADTIRAVRVFDRASGTVRELERAECGFAYRDSVFRRAPGRFVVLSVTFVLARRGAPTVRYGELRDAVGETPTLAAVHAAVLQLRRAKSMLLEPGDENRRSCGSFFTNPIVDDADAARVRAEASAPMPSWPAGEGRTKLAAGWLIEQAGLHKGLREGHFGLSTRHALAVVHHGGGTTAELVRFAQGIQARIEDRFGVRLAPEPVFVGFEAPPLG